MVCAKCARLTGPTQLVTQTTKRATELPYGSSSAAKPKTAGSSTLGHTGVSKSKLLSKSARNPFAAYAGSCSTCKTKTEQGRKYCHRCAYKANACAMCGKSQSKDKAKAGAAPVVQGQRFSAK